MSSESQVQCPKHATQPASQGVQLAIHQSSPQRDLLLFNFFRTPRSAPHFTTQLRVQPWPDVCSGLRGDQATENARRPRHGWKNASIIENEHSAGLGFSIESERAPRKLGGGERNERRKEGPLTLSAFSRPQFTQIHSKIFFTFTMKP